MRKVILIFTFFLFLFSVFADDPEINTEKNKTGIEPSVTFPEYEENDSTRVPKSEFHKKSDMGVYNKEDYPDIFRPGGECCYTATVIPSIPYSDTGSTTGAANDYDEVCPYDCSIAPDVVYSYSPPDNVVIDIDLCNSSYDTKLYIYQNSCESANLVACNDDYWYGPPDDDCYMYSSYLPEVELFVGNEYFFIIDGYGPYHGNYELTIVQTGSTIPPGIDQWHQTNHCESRITFGDTGDVPTIAADFFGPGSDPFDGCVYLQGVPFPDDPLECTDTIIERLEEADLTDPPCTDVIDTEIVAMTLTSTAPIRVTGSGDFPAESFFDVFVEIDLPQLGDMSITKENEQGGTFTANLPVEPRFTFTPVDGGPPLEIVTEIIPLALTGEHPFSSVSQDPFIPGPGPLVLTAPGGSQLSIDPCPTRMDHFYGYMSGGYMEGGGTGYESTWFYYPEDDWWNIWFYDHPYDPDRTKSIFTSFTLNPLDPSPYAEVVFNWTTPAWSDLGLDRPPLPDDFTGGIPESTYIERSAPIFAGPLTELVPVEVYYDIPDYNPEWISIDISGTDFSIEYGYIWHICNSNYGENLREFGDAPEGELGYPSSGLPGQFPTCINEPTSGHIQHNNNTGAWFGSSFDFEPEGNAGACPTFNPDTYNEDECFGGLDPGLSIPPAYTIQGSIGSEVVNPCTITGSLGTICQTANWGPDIDILVHNTRPNEPPYQIAYVNVLADWNQDGIWANDPGTQCTGTPVPEHILVNFVIPPLYYALLSGLTPPGFQIGPNPDFVWVRFSITETPVGTDWHGDGVFEDGETEDYLLKIDDTEIDFGDAPAPYPTLETNNGARHNIAGPWLGDGTDSPDAEPDGQPNALALGDDFDVLYPPPNDDEDGVRFGSLIKGSSANVRITASGAGTLNAWLDFNADNDWADAGEQIFTNQALVAGQNSLTINVPASAAQGFTYARFRFSTAGGLSYIGAAPDGEVEDYLIFIQDPIDNIKMSNPQYPDPFGWDVMTFPFVVADDWMCSETGTVDAVHFWISFKDDYIYPPDPPYGIDWLYISIHSNNPIGPDGWSVPDVLLWEDIFFPDQFIIEPYFDNLQGWYSPAYEDTLPENHYQCFQVDIPFIPEPFIQEAGTIYWLDISIISMEPDYYIGWKTSLDHWEDNAVWKEWFETMWFELWDPIEDSLSLDMAFVITGQLATPSDITIYVIEDSSLVYIEWTTVPGATSYKVYSSTDPDADFPSGWTLEGTTSNIYYEDGPPLPTGRKKFFKVVAQ